MLSTTLRNIDSTSVWIPHRLYWAINALSNICKQCNLQHKNHAVWLMPLLKMALVICHGLGIYTATSFPGLLWWNVRKKALAKAGCHMTRFSNIFGKFIREINTQEVARKILQIYWKIWSCDNQPLPGPSTSRSTTEALGTRLYILL